jgi:nucleoside-diphosphate-sugar epimerase
VTDNAVMNSYLLREAFERKVRHFIFFSCTVMYPSSDTKLKESDWNGAMEIHPRYFGVANTKVYVEKMLEFYSRISEMKTTAIRHSNIYGPHDKFDLERSHVFGATVTKTLTATDRVVVWGTGEEERDLLHVDDLVDFVAAAIDRQVDKHRLYNCGLGMKITIRDLVKKIVAASGRKLDIEHDTSQPSIKTSLFLDTSLATHELGWEPKVSLDDGIARTIAWWVANVRPTLKLASRSGIEQR